MALLNRGRTARAASVPGESLTRPRFRKLGRFRVDLSQIHQDDLRIIAALISMLVMGTALTLLSFSLAPDSVFSIVVLDRQSPLYPMTVQNLLHFMFALGVGESFVRFHSSIDARRQIDKNLLAVGRSQLLSDGELEQLQELIKRDGAGNDRHLHRLVHRVILQYRATGSVGESQAVLNSSVEYFQHEIGLRYNMLRYLTWLLPTLGFIGTLIGISLALAGAASLPNLENHAELESWINALTANLGVAFYTTLVALGLSSILVFLTSIASGREERALNETGQYCLDNLINRLRNRNIATATQSESP